MEETVQKKQEKQKKNHDCRSRDRPLKEGDHMYVINFRSGTAWVLRDILKQTGPVLFQVKVAGGITLRRHIDQLCSQVTHCPLNSETSEAEENSCSFLGSPLSLSSHSTPTQVSSPPIIRHSKWDRRPPSRLLPGYTF